MLYKYRPPAITTWPTTKSMPQLDFREALSTPEEKRASPAATVAAISAAAPDLAGSVWDITKAASLNGGR